MHSPQCVARSIAAVMVAAAVVTGCGTNPAARTTLFDFESSMGGTVPNFVAPAGWQLIYTWDCSQQRSQGNAGANHFSFVIYNADDDSIAAEQKAEVSRTGLKGGDTIHYKNNGTYTIDVNSECHYRLRGLVPNN